MLYMFSAERDLRCVLRHVWCALFAGLESVCLVRGLKPRTAYEKVFGPENAAKPPTTSASEREPDTSTTTEKVPMAVDTTDVCALVGTRISPHNDTESKSGESCGKKHLKWRHEHDIAMIVWLQGRAAVTGT